MDYSSISKFLDKFRIIIKNKDEVKNAIINAVSQEISQVVDKNSIKIKGNSIYIEGSPMFHSEILIHKKQILEKLKILLPENNFINIK